MSLPPVLYRVSLEERHSHYYRIEADFPVADAELDVQLPVWTPGSYLVREYQRHLQELTATDEHGHSLLVRKIDKSTWRIRASVAHERIRLGYRVYAYDLTVRAAHLDGSHAYWNGAPLFLYAPTLRERAIEVTLPLPNGWHTTTALPETSPGVFAAWSYDELVDSPFESGTHEVISFAAQGRPHRLAVWGRLEKNRDELVADFVRIIDSAAQIFGGVPYDSYTFILLLSPNAYGGLEHATSSTLLTSPHVFAAPKKYVEFLELVAHEYFHLWNVKRIHPEALGPFDYQKEALTRSLWLVEGATSYYDRHLLLRAGLISPKDYFDKLADELHKIETTPGAAVQSLEEASFDAWIKFYRPDENSANSSVSYYLKGGAVVLLADLEIRARTEGRRSFDDVMRHLWQHYGQVGKGFADDALQGEIESAAGVDLSALFDRYVRGCVPLDGASWLRSVGLEQTPAESDDEPGGWLGVNTRDEGHQLVVSAQIVGGPAAAEGLYALDVLLALDGFRIEGATLKDRLAAKRPGERVTLTIFRRDELRTVDVTLGRRPTERPTLAPARNATAAEKSAFEAWAGVPFPPLED